MTNMPFVQEINTRNFTLLTALILTSVIALRAQDATPAAEALPRAASPAVVNPATRAPIQLFLSLDGEWTFRTDPNNVGEAGKWFQPRTAWSDTRTLLVPGCWEAQGVGSPGEYALLSPRNLTMSYVEAGMKTEYEGIGWYRKEVTIPPAWSGKQVWLKFGGVNAVGRAYVNGILVAALGGPGQYSGTYKYNVTDLVKPGKAALIVVMVRNDVPSSKGSRNVARRYGGIDGSVELEATPAVLIDYADVLTDAAKHSATVNVTLRHVGENQDAVTKGVLRVVVRDPGGKVVGQTAHVPAEWTGETGSKKIEIPLSPCALWSPEHPALHTAEITLEQNGKVLHGWTERFGVANWTVQGTDLLLNGKKFLVRGIGFDANWPITICYPLDRATLRKFMTTVKSYGYNHVRLWSHSPPPEFCQAADESGICLTVELPYYHNIPDNRQGHHWEHLPQEYNIPQQDLEEVLAQYRRFPSIFTFSGGNEGTLDGDHARLLKTVHEQAPGKLWTIATGHIFNRPGVSDYNPDYFARLSEDGKTYLPGSLPNFPHILHEYSNPAYAFDPRNAAKYTTGYLPPIPLEVYQQHVADGGLSWPWAEAVIDASEEMTFYYQKLATENARTFSDPPLSGYEMWGPFNSDTHFYAQQEGGVLDPLFGPKKGGTPAFYRQFNGPVVLLAKITPHGTPFHMSLTNAHGGDKPKVEAYADQLVFASGQTMDVDFWLSNFSERDLKGKLVWAIRDGKKTLIENSAESAARQGEVVSLSKISWTVPELKQPVRLTVTARLQGTDVANSWDIWAFPRPESYSRTLTGVVATPKVYEVLSPRYPGLVKYEVGQPLPEGVTLLLSDDLASAQAACREGKRVLLLSLQGFTGFQPPVQGGDWIPTLQEGTALAVDHPVFRGFPAKEYLEPVFTRMMGQAALFTPAFKNVTPIMVGAARIPGKRGKTLPDYLVYAFEAAPSQGRLLATGLNLLTDAPEAAALLDGFLAYAQSSEFDPHGRFDIQTAMAIRDNGRGKILQFARSEPHKLFLGPKSTSLAVSDQPDKPLEWETANAPERRGAGNPLWEAICFVGMGAVDEKSAEFTLSLNGKPVVDLTVSLDDAIWRGSDGVSVSYQVKENATQITHSTIFADLEKAMGTGKKSVEWESSGILRLSIPTTLLTPNQPVTLKIEAKKSDGRGWLGLISP